MDTNRLDEILAQHQLWLDGKGGERANLSSADLCSADLSGADLDYSCWPLWCGSKGVKVDNRLVFQLAAHICVLDCETPEYKTIKEMLTPYARQCHRAHELGLEVADDR